MAKLQNPVTAGFDAINNDLKEVSKAQKTFGKALDKVCVQTTISRHRTNLDLHPFL